METNIQAGKVVSVGIFIKFVIMYNTLTVLSYFKVHTLILLSHYCNFDIWIHNTTIVKISKFLNNIASYVCAYQIMQLSTQSPVLKEHDQQIVDCSKLVSSILQDIVVVLLVTVPSLTGGHKRWSHDALHNHDTYTFLIRRS